MDRWVQTASVLHSNGDAYDFAVKDGRIVGVRGRSVDRVNHGRLGPKDLYGWQAIQSPDRLTTPLIRAGDRFVPEVQVNNLHLLRAMLGRPGAGIYQMNGQPTAQNTRESGADGDCRVCATGTTPSTSVSSRRCGTWTRR